MKTLPNPIRSLLVPALIGAVIIFTMEGFVLVSTSNAYISNAINLFEANSIAASYQR